MDTHSRDPGGGFAGGKARFSRIFEDFSAVLDTDCLTFTYPLADVRGSVWPAILYCLNRRAFAKQLAMYPYVGVGYRMNGVRVADFPGILPNRRILHVSAT